ncbi:hypothetical protein, partial [uncultured Bifidobacterium sp.]|uniref:hypothetical protein n=1 Tax=uncultured Bifidobacterium sp. TaxID=165187 RepID=UPI00258B924E
HATVSARRNADLSVPRPEWESVFMKTPLPLPHRNTIAAALFVIASITRPKISFPAPARLLHGARKTRYFYLWRKKI